MTIEHLPAEANASAGLLLEETALPAQQVHGKVAVYGAVTEYTAEIPHDLESTEMVTWINGFGAFKKTMRGIGRETANLGYANVRFKPIRRSGRTAIEKWQDATQVHIDAVDAVLDDLSTNPMLQDIEHGSELNFSSITLAPHSYGGETANRYALAHPDSISKIINIETVGQEDPKLLRFLGRFPLFAYSELVPFVRHHGPDFALWDLQKAVDYMFSDPVQTIGEMKACFLSDNRQDYYRLQEYGIGTALITGQRDTLVPAEPIEAAAADMADYYECIDSNHLGPQQEPAKFAAAVVRAIHALNEQRKPQLSVVPD